MKIITASVLLALVSSQSVLAGQSPYGAYPGQRIGSGPGQVNWPPTGGMRYPTGGYYPPAYPTARQYYPNPYQVAPNRYYPPTDYVAPPNQNWSPEAATMQPSIAPDVLLQEKKPFVQEVGSDIIKGSRPGNPIGFESGGSIQVIPPPNIVLKPGEELKSSRLNSGWRPNSGRMVSQ